MEKPQWQVGIKYRSSQKGEVLGIENRPKVLIMELVLGLKNNEQNIFQDRF